MTMVTWPKSPTRGICKTEQIGEDRLPVALGFLHFHGDLLKVKDSRGILVQYIELLIEKTAYYDD